MKKTVFLLISMSFVLMGSACSVYTYDDYASYEAEKMSEAAENGVYYYTGADEIYTVGDIVLIDECNTEATLILAKPSTYVKAEVTDAKICRSSKDYLAYISERPWIPEMLNNDISSGFKYDFNNNTFTHNTFGLDISLYIISMKFYNPTDSDQTIAFGGFRLMERDPKTGFFRRLNIPEAYFCASEEYIEDSKYTIAPGGTFETDLLSLQFSERILSRYQFKGENASDIKDTEKYNEDSIYLRLNLSGRRDIQDDENFIKIKQTE